MGFEQRIERISKLTHRRLAESFLPAGLDCSDEVVVFPLHPLARGRQSEKLAALARWAGFDDHIEFELPADVAGFRGAAGQPPEVRSPDRPVAQDPQGVCAPGKRQRRLAIELHPKSKQHLGE